jgi:hypothetical protein
VNFRFSCRADDSLFDVCIEHGIDENPAPTQIKEKDMRFLSIYKSVERATPASQEEMAVMGKMVEDGMKAGWLVATEGCLPSSLGARVRRSSNKITVTDGPFTESTEVVGGFAIFKVNSKEEAVELARQFLKVVGEGECELRQLYDM